MYAEKNQYFVLVHGACHGAWIWYKIKPLLEEAGHRVTAIDLAASGINEKRLEELHSLEDYTMPLLQLMAAIPPTDKVILVGHSYGGFNIALAMDCFPEKVSVAVFLAALMPDTNHPPSYVLDQYFQHISPGHMLDTRFLPYGSQEDGGGRTSINFGPNYISAKLADKCNSEDIELAKMLIRPMSLFPEELSNAKAFSNAGYGSIKRVYIIINEDKGVPLSFQKWLVENIGVEDIKEINNADHNAMLSNPQQLSRCLLEVASLPQNLGWISLNLISDI